nr:MAG TPA: ATP synthase [Caudoviricetes sp.]
MIKSFLLICFLITICFLTNLILYLITWYLLGKKIKKFLDECKDDFKLWRK